MSVVGDSEAVGVTTIVGVPAVDLEVMPKFNLERLEARGETAEDPPFGEEVDEVPLRGEARVPALFLALSKNDFKLSLGLC